MRRVALSVLYKAVCGGKVRAAVCGIFAVTVLGTYVCLSVMVVVVEGGRSGQLSRASACPAPRMCCILYQAYKRAKLLACAEAGVVVAHKLFRVV